MWKRLWMAAMAVVIVGSLSVPTSGTASVGLMCFIDGSLCPRTGEEYHPEQCCSGMCWDWGHKVTCESEPPQT